jgi:hypothetical protein
MSATYTDNNDMTQNCPNIEEDGELNKSWGSWVTTPDELKNNVDYNQKCYDICGPRNYIQQIGGISFCDQTTTECPIIFPRPADYDEQLSDLGQYADMCSVTEIGGDIQSQGGGDEPRETWEGEEEVPIWFIRQKDANLDGEYVGGLLGLDWASSEAEGYWSQSDRALSDNEIRGFMGGLRTNQLMTQTESGYIETDNGEFYNNFPEGYTDMTDLRNDINENRGSMVKCDDNNRPSWMTECIGDNPATDSPPSTASDSHFGPQNIIYEEVVDFFNALREERLERSRVASGADATEQDRRSLMGMMGDASANPLFEECMNELFETGFIPDDYPSGYTEMDVMNEISNIQSINDLTNYHITYIRLKLKKIAQTDETDAIACMNRLNIGESICNTGISDKILRSAYLVSAMMGMNNLDVSDIERGTPEYMRLSRLVNELGYLLPQAFKKIIDISLLYEEQYCGSVTTSTRVLEQLYDNLYTNNREVNIDIMPSFDMNMLIDSDPLYFFQKMVVIFVIAYSVSVILRALREVKKIVE